MDNFVSPIHLTCMSLDCGRDPTQTQGEHANSTQKGPGPPHLGPEPSTLLSSTGHCDDPALSMVSKDSIRLVIKDENVSSFIITEGVLVTVSLQDSTWSFNLYKEASCSTRSTLIQKLAGFPFPAVATVPNNTTDARDWMLDSLPTLTSIYPSSSSKEHRNKHNYYLNSLLFRLLFGVDAALVNSPVIFCGLPDGRIVFFPLLLPALTTSRGELKQPIRILYSLEQPVTYIGTSVIGELGPQSLVVIGQRGRILLVRANQTTSDGKPADYNFIEHTVQNPVVCACVDGEHLYYSTFTNMFTLSLSKIFTSSSDVTTVSEAKSTKQEKPSVFPQNAVCLNVCRVISIAEPSVSHTGCVQMLAVSLSGKLLHVSLPQEPGKACLSRLSSLQAGQKVKDLLAGIGNVWERASALKHQLQMKNDTLKCLNQVLTICHLLLNSKDQEICNDKPLISCHGFPKWNTLLQKDSLELTCILENLSGCALDQGWTLCLQVQSVCSLHTGGTSRTYSFTLKKLDCGQKIEVTVPLDSDGDIFLPVQIQCLLVYSLQSLFNPEKSRTFCANDVPLSQLLTDTSCISLPLSSLTLDWLDALRIVDPGSQSGGIPKQISSWEATYMLLSSRQIHTEAVPNTAPYTVAINISSDLLRSRLNIQNCSSAVLCISVLKWLVCGTSKEDGQKLVQSPVVCVYGPDGHAVRLLTKEVILSDFSAQGPLPVIEVQVESSSMAAVCGLHHAVLQRAQVLLKDAGEKCESSAQLRCQRLCEAVWHLESVFKDLQDCHEPAAFDGGMKPTRAPESLFQLYLQLRQNPLVII
ncbi:Fanconi anemia core complex-associated protein 100 isoform X2 [Trichomycterus rosablanca]|uniref:Fanconi anemia core complex-associated protein 100 isoform X2 n=1 Tax=Trichomycterus rosablanca TaxID=2290929 RepID=UPI002F3543F8